MAVGCLVVVVLVGALSLGGAEDLPPAAGDRPAGTDGADEERPDGFPGGAGIGPRTGTDADVDADDCCGEDPLAFSPLCGVGGPGVCGRRI
ncbi:hypothetical protein ABZX98_27855 [Streptomyces sp. NPDC002992]|uniref:hypothetical protein n=1 Tax=Streptomyces sp. NPDC002992 TaxID=3154273 RepID=UPI0033A6EA81